MPIPLGALPASAQYCIDAGWMTPSGYARAWGITEAELLAWLNGPIAFAPAVPWNTVGTAYQPDGWGISAEHAPEPAASFFQVDTKSVGDLSRMLAVAWPDTIMTTPDLFLEPTMMTMTAPGGIKIDERKIGWPVGRDKIAFDLDNGYAEYAKGEFDEVGQTWTAHRVYLRLKE